MNWKVWFGAWVILFGLPSLVLAQFSLWMVERAVQVKHPVPDISHQELHDQMRSSDATQYLVFDIRELDEYRVSHLPAAVQVDPDTEVSIFLDTYGASIHGKRLVFYCSVGYRSSIFVERLQQESLAHGAQSLENLRGGIFRWFNEGKTVVDESGTVEKVHPFNEKWGSMVKRRD